MYFTCTLVSYSVHVVEIMDWPNAAISMDTRGASASAKGAWAGATREPGSIIWKATLYDDIYRKRLLKLEPICEHESELTAKRHREDDGDIQKRCKIHKQ